MQAGTARGFIGADMPSGAALDGAAELAGGVGIIMACVRAPAVLRMSVDLEDAHPTLAGLEGARPTRVVPAAAAPALVVRQGLIADRGSERFRARQFAGLFFLSDHLFCWMLCARPSQIHSRNSYQTRGGVWCSKLASVGSQEREHTSHPIRYGFMVSAEEVIFFHIFN